MKKAAIAFVALPLLCMGAGYGAGLALAPAPAEAAEAEVDEKTPHGAEDTASKAKDGHGEDAAEVVHGENQEPMDSYELAKDRTVVRLGQMTIPVEKTNSVSYVVADFALKMGSLELAERYRRVEDATRMRDSLLQAMNLAAESAVLRGVAIDSEALSQLLRDLISKEHQGVDDVMFVSLYKQDVARL
ncbi:hypothetical protein DSM110093_02500 [Sulfitobacter sp. DSM 110093]|uniref:hypothetical protein n=1 Tax=Sulfitobacter sp. DSM 110093 TaxID=2883127 RepID=UPI001FAB6164|nr:hypothetical protein [Sulfitobacter sp. DSM 110093]UOA32698.1 hypothetical protein DSM110093_02500 [Sulfitobacter sp. DSM 110093]